jgi:hypothetical protein
MTFIEALKTGRPMRRNSGYHRPWLYLGTDVCHPYTPRWRFINTGEETGLHSFDYTADDWEVMP